MNNNRRSFLRNASLATGLLLIQKPLTAIASVAENARMVPGNSNALLIRHTNDLCGVLRQRAYEGMPGLLVDAGNFLDDAQSREQQLLMVKAMNNAGYQVATIGNRELAKGTAHLAALAAQMQFALVNCNYQFADAALKKQVQTYHIVYAGPYKVGITGVGPMLKNVSGVKYLPPVEAASRVAKQLKEVHDCDFVICLSHLGFEQPGAIADNQTMAIASSHIDFVIGGHQDKMITTTIVYRNTTGNEVYLSQAGTNGIMTGEMKLLYNDERRCVGIEPRSIMS
ncbi:hypothetical protein CLV51_102654 [Chitinophaga niastensis]|uniref:5'-nucleotidase n=1 Tax=Chitinophaga niastensis TaxID=536980 RepID=A0A2P8HNL0_CHINA|nr:bifunctional metallophosphatase/5'-nucleotidase [Chitinophaga niastensis]PSL47794.1 hypothetical protein CLV51_102654 [Chitinophaga niastensis]